jgi:uroporphyrinogen-III synthase
MSPALFIGRKVSIETKNWLLENQVDFEEHPLIDFEYSNPDLSMFSATNGPKYFVVSSNRAANWLAAHYREAGFSDNDAVFCLSGKQKSQILSFTENVLVSPLQNAASLAKLVVSQKTKAIVVLLQGSESLDIIPAELESFGINFINVEVYKNIRLKPEIKSEFDVYLFFSPSAVQSFTDGKNRIPEKAGIVAIGETTAATCRLHFSNTIFIAEVPDELTMIKLAAGIKEKNNYQNKEIDYVKH